MYNSRYTYFHSIDALRIEFVTLGAVPALINCLSFTDTQVQTIAMHALGMLCCDSSARQQLVESNGVPPLLSCLQSPSAELVQQATWALSIAAQSNEVATLVGQQGYVH